MENLRPGGFRITDRAVELARFQRKDRILDIGCGQGDTVARLCREFDMEAEGIDLNLARIDQARKAHPNIQVKFGDGEFLDDYSSFTFDGVFMECALSMINIPDEALHEAYCVLKKGGRLVISDLYEKAPDLKKLEAVRIEAERQRKLPHKEGDCGEDPVRFVDFRLDGVFFKKPLLTQLKEIGYEIVAFEDRSADLDDYVAQTLLEEGSLENLCTCVDLSDRSRRLGYFLLVARKPEK